MSINNVSSMGTNLYDYACSRRKTMSTSNFAEKAKEASEERDTVQRTALSAWAGGYGNLATAELFWFYI